MCSVAIMKTISAALAIFSQLAGCAGSVAANASQEAPVSCVRCPEWLDSPGSVSEGTMCVQAGRLAAAVLDCAYELGDCPDMLRDDAPNVECIAALADQCAAQMSACASDVPDDG